MRITSDNLDQTVQINQQIQRDIEKYIKILNQVFKKYEILSPEKQALQILKEHYLIQLPIPDENWGGAVKTLPTGSEIPVINTAQPRLYQYFIYWHEIFHLLEDNSEEVKDGMHEILTEFDIRERRADYFASQMLISRDVYDFYFNLTEKSFIDRISFCMDTFKAPYKAILIQLYELAIAFHNERLQHDVKTHFDLKLSQEEWIEQFKKLSLDDTLVTPSYVVDFGLIKRYAEEMSIKYPDDRAYQDTKEYIFSLENKFKSIRNQIAHGQLSRTQ